MKEFIKQLIKRLPIAFTRNQQYDRQTAAVIRRVCKPDTHFIDVGCHKGEVMDLVLRSAPQGPHWGFEPIPDLYAALLTKYQQLPVTISDIALSSASGTTTFNYVVSNPSYSGLRKRQYDRPNERDTTIEVQMAQMDAVLPPDYRVDLIKIDVEGAELLVLEGARATLKRWKPVVIFEHGLGASEFYEATPAKVFQLLTDCGLNVSLMQRWLQGQVPLTLAEFTDEFQQKRNYYFIAYA
jgi:FkbM family methyltransferase